MPKSLRKQWNIFVTVNMGNTRLYSFEIKMSIILFFSEVLNVLMFYKKDEIFWSNIFLPLSY